MKGGEGSCTVPAQPSLGRRWEVTCKNCGGRHTRKTQQEGKGAEADPYVSKIRPPFLTPPQKEQEGKKRNYADETGGMTEKTRHMEKGGRKGPIADIPDAITVYDVRQFTLGLKM